MKKIPIGITDFKKLISQDCYFVDKSLLIKELLDNRSEVTLLPRPRRFGKTLNMSMLHCFFEKNDASQASLFDGLAITKHPEIMKHQGQYPVIFLSLKDAKKDTWEQCYAKLTGIIQQEFKRHAYLKNSAALTEAEKKYFVAILHQTAPQHDYERALHQLISYLHQHHGAKPIVLIDEYDAPIHAGFTHNYYQQVVGFIRSFLGSALKDNNNLNFSVLTGILRIAKESIFSGLNHLDVSTLLSVNYADKFGLLRHEVKEILNHFDIPHAIDDIKHWYNGYTFGNQKEIYNPWSIINLIHQKGALQPYWINTSDNILIRDLITRNNLSFNDEMNLLLNSQTIEKHINENITFESLDFDDDMVWSLLLYAGYLTVERQFLEGNMPKGLLRIPNQELAYFYSTAVSYWFKKNLNIKEYEAMLKSLVSGELEGFKHYFSRITKVALSTFDISGDEPEQFYHVLVVGMLVSLQNEYEVLSNRESGWGRYDVMIIPRTVTPEKYGIIIEFKRVTTKHPTLEKAVEAAFAQIEEKQYEIQLKDRGIEKIIKLAIAFEGKQTLVEEIVS